MDVAVADSGLFGLKAARVQALQACGAQPNHGQGSQEAKEAPTRAEMLGSTDGEWKVVGAVH